MTAPRRHVSANIMYQVSQLENLNEVLKSLKAWYHKYEQAYGAEFDEHWRLAEPLIAREQEFRENPSVESAEKLDSDWQAWADGLLECLQNSRLDLLFDDEERVLNRFVNARRLFRKPFLAHLPRHQ